MEIAGFSGSVLTSPSALALAADDFGHVVRSVPAVVARPALVSDVAVAVRWAAARGWQVAARGLGHSVYGRSQVAGGVVVDLAELSSVSVVGADRVVVEAGASWRSVVAAALSTGLTPPVLPNFLDLSVGGTLSVGGVGGATHRYGFQTDNVLSLEVVTGSGSVVTCSPTVNPALFDAVRGGLGQFGIIVRAELTLVPAPSSVRLYTLPYPSLAALASAQLRLLERGGVDHLQGSVLVGDSRQYVLEVGVFDGAAELDASAQVDELPYAAYVHGFDRFTELLRSTGEWSLAHPWFLTFLPSSTAVEVASSIVHSLQASDLGAHGRVLFYPVPTAALRTPLLRVPSEPVAFVFNLIRFGPESLVAQNARFYKQVREAGGVLYPVSALPWSPADWREHFGVLWPGIVQDKERFDPAHLLTPGYELFARWGAR
ncbi:FAD-binding protein [Tenggerimyces flavus]|uniref:FAD-binding protein n=1 Tax=Tenggerimyces flavus TaxID=1708749 RepID=A0ABV7YIU1_9ACTN|nr:FAD-binding protein [Tenggerimyces flavus]MBM7789856.1 FAD/FMN-containing dehydrogenase [Tenggerimyces flavus]